MAGNINKSKGSKIFKQIWNKTASVNINKKVRTIYPIRLLLFLIITLTVFSFIMSFIANGIGTKTVELPFESGGAYSVYQTEKDMVLFNNRGIKGISTKGDVVWSIDNTLSQPLVEVREDFLLLCDLAGNHYAASYKNGKKQIEYNLQNDIISAKITKSGNAVFATDTDGYKGKVTVYNKRGREVYVWNSGVGYVTDVELTDNARFLMVSQLLTDGTESSGKLQFIDTSRGEVIASVEIGGEAIVNIKLLSDNKLVVVTDNSILGFNHKGKELFNISLMGKSPSLYSIESDDIIAVVTLDNRGTSVIETYNYLGKHLGSYSAEGVVRTIAARDKKVCVAEQKGIVTLNARGKVKDIKKIAHDISEIGIFSGGDRALAVGTSMAETISIR